MNDPFLIGIILTQRCNARCAHCSTSSAPERTECLSLEDIRRVMHEAAATLGGRRVQFCLSGGEPFLDASTLLEAVGCAHALAAEVTCVTNAYWARSPAAARARLEPLCAAGLTALAVSTSEFHVEHVDLERVRNALHAAQELGLPAVVKFPHRRGGLQPDELRRALGDDLALARFEHFSFLPFFRDGGPGLPESEFVRDTRVPSGACPLPVLTVREDGNVYSCCTPGAFTESLRVGNIHRDEFAEILTRFEFGGLQRILFQRGPAELVRRLAARGADPELRSAYSDECDLCTSLACNARLAPSIAAVAEEEALDALAGVFAAGLLAEEEAIPADELPPEHVSAALPRSTATP